MSLLFQPCFVIAEAGVNHNGSLDMALELVDAAALAGSDAVKFQTFVTSEALSAHAFKADYQMANSDDPAEDAISMISKLELDEKAHLVLIERCRQRGIRFMSTAFDLGSVDLLLKLGMEIFKIPSGEITNYPLLNKIGHLNKKLIVSTGMATMEEIDDAIKLLTASGTKRDNITLLHCTTEYPAPFADINLKAMLAMREQFGLNVGYSDHSPGISIPVAAVALGASIIEKHLTLDNTLPGPDHKASLEPWQFKDMVTAIKNVEKALGDGCKRPMPSEIPNIPVARKSIVAARAIKAGEILSADNLAAKRPGTGMSPMLWPRLLGRAASRDYNQDDFINELL